MGHARDPPLSQDRSRIVSPPHSRKQLHLSAPLLLLQHLQFLRSPLLVTETFSSAPCPHPAFHPAVLAADCFHCGYSRPVQSSLSPVALPSLSGSHLPRLHTCCSPALIFPSPTPFTSSFSSLGPQQPHLGSFSSRLYLGEAPLPCATTRPCATTLLV